MPTYRLRCRNCGDSEKWFSIVTGPSLTCVGCGGPVQQVLTPPRLYGVGEHGRRTLEVDETEREWDRDLPAYKRLRHAGHQPLKIDGADRLEATAASDWEIKTGGRVKGNERQINEAVALAAEITAGRA